MSDRDADEETKDPKDETPEEGGSEAEESDATSAKEDEESSPADESDDDESDDDDDKRDDDDESDDDDDDNESDDDKRSRSASGPAPLLMVALGLAVGAAAGWFGHQMQVEKKMKAADAAVEGSGEGARGPCKDWETSICSAMGDASFDCQQAKTASPLLSGSACQTASTGLPATLERMKAARAPCTELEKRLCDELGAESQACGLVKTQTPTFPAQRCTDMMPNYDKVLEQLKAMEARGSLPGMQRPGGPAGHGPGGPGGPHGPGGPGGPQVLRPGTPGGPPPGAQPIAPSPPNSSPAAPAQP